MDDLAMRIAKCRNWRSSRISAALRAKYPKVRAEKLLAYFQDSGELQALELILRFDQSMAQLSRSGFQIPIAGLFTMAAPQKRCESTQFSTFATALREQLSPRQKDVCDSRLVEGQRAVLVQYLLQLPFFRKKGIEDADGLFEYFFIGVQMGPLMKTSRIKEAISTETGYNGEGLQQTGV